MKTSYEKINSEVIKFNKGLEQLPTNTQLDLFIEFNKKVLKLLEQLTRDKIGLELLKVLEKKLKGSLNTTEYVKQLHCLLIGDENNFINQQARKKYELKAKAFSDLNSWLPYGVVIGLLTGMGVFLTLALCLVITPAPVHLVFMGLAAILGASLSISCGHSARSLEVELLNQNYRLQKEHNKLLIDFDQSIPNQQEIPLTEEEKEDKPPFETALRMRKLQFFYRDHGEEIQQKIASLSI